MDIADLNYKIEETKDNYQILRINKNDKWVYIGSKYNMTAEIDRFLKKFENANKEQSVLLVYGFGTGEHLKKLRKKYVKNTIIVFEPNKCLEEYIKKNDFINKDKNLIVICEDLDNMRAVMKSYIDEFNLEHIQCAVFANYDKVYVNEYAEYLKKVKDSVTNTRININTRTNFSKRWFETLMNNIPYMIDGVPADEYRNKYKNKPAIIVSAGPSLQKNIDELKNIHNDMFIISSGRTLRSLIEKDIDFNLLVVSDPLPMSYIICKDYIEGLNKPLLFSDGSNDDVVAHHTGDKIFFAINDFVSKVAGRYVEPMMSKGSVAHDMTSYAIMLGCNPIIFIGQDLAYTGDRSHAQISENVEIKIGFDDLKSETDIYVEDINGGKVRTSLSLNSYRLGLQEIIECFPETTFINATEGGAKIKGTIQMTLKEAIDKYKSKEKIEPLEKIKYPIDMRNNAIKYLKATRKACGEISKGYKETIGYLKDLSFAYKIRNTNKINSILSKLDVIDNRIQKKFKEVSLIEPLLFPIIHNVLADKNNDSDLNKDEVLEKNKKMYLDIINEVDYANDKIDELLKKLEY